MDFHPKLKNAMEEIKEILRKHDIAAVIVLHTPGYTEYLTNITPTYSCAKFDELSGNFQMKGKKEHFNNEADRINKLSDTSNMMHCLSHVTGQIAVNLLDSSEKVDKAFGSDHNGKGHTSHQSQNN